MTTNDTRREAVRERYAAAALQVLEDKSAACCASGCCNDGEPASDCCESACCNDSLYSADEVGAAPPDALRASLGCGNPTALIDLTQGQTVLDLGSGGGIDVLLSARRVGPTGKVFGLDMTDEMLALARRNAEAAGAHNVEFLKGAIEAVPLPDASVDVVISNCVINLSTDKPAVLSEAYRVLRPGGRFAVSDIVVQGSAIGPEVADDLALWSGCVAGALQDAEYRQLLDAAGFEDVSITETSVYDAGLPLAPGQRVISAFVRASKPLTPPPTRSILSR
ncbi:MAG: arsenite methyltransferase [Dehalococcoidia bacterium]